jgi:HEAT repeat protein
MESGQPDANSQLTKEINRYVNNLVFFFHRNNAMESLIRIGEPAVLPLLQAIHHRDEDVRRCAALVLGNIGDQRAVLPLCELLKDFHDEIRTAAASALIKIGEPAILPLVDMLQNNREGGRRSLLETFEETIENTSESARRSVTFTLGKLGEPAVLPLLETLNDGNPPVRAAAASALGMIGDGRAVLPLSEMLGESDHGVRSNVVEALGEIGDARATLPLCKALTDDHKMVRRNACYALGVIGDDRAILPLCEALKDSNNRVRSAAAAALEKFGDTLTLPLRTLSSELLTPVQKLETLEALRTGEFSVRYPPVLEYCRTLLELSTNAAVQEGARTVLIEARKRSEQQSYLRSSMSHAHSQDLLRAASGVGNACYPEELMRAAQSPDQQTSLPYTTHNSV